MIKTNIDINLAFASLCINAVTAAGINSSSLKAKTSSPRACTARLLAAHLSSNRLHLIEEVWPVYAASEPFATFNLQNVFQILTDLLGGCGGQGYQGNSRELLLQDSKLSVVRPVVHIYSSYSASLWS